MSHTHTHCVCSRIQQKNLKSGETSLQHRGQPEHRNTKSVKDCSAFIVQPFNKCCCCRAKAAAAWASASPPCSPSVHNTGSTSTLWLWQHVKKCEVIQEVPYVCKRGSCFSKLMKCGNSWVSRSALPRGKDLRRSQTLALLLYHQLT